MTETKINIKEPLFHDLKRLSETLGIQLDSLVNNLLKKDLDYIEYTYDEAITYIKSIKVDLNDEKPDLTRNLNKQGVNLEILIRSERYKQIKQFCNLINWPIDLFIESAINKELDWIRERMDAGEQEYVFEYYLDYNTLANKVRTIFF